MPLVLASALGLVFFSTGESSEGSGPVAVAEPPEPAQAAQREATQASLRALRGGIGVYRAVNGGLPGALAELVATSESWPNGFLSSTSLPLDGWGSPFHFELAESGDAYRLWSAGPDGVDQGGEGDDVLAP